MCTTEDIEQPPVVAITRHAGAVTRVAVGPLYGVWLVLTLCRTCNARTGFYCQAHRVKVSSEMNR